jgi:hypothetical protein
MNKVIFENKDSKGMKPSVYVIINEQHTLMPDQIKALEKIAGEEYYNLVKIPSKGLTKDEQYELSQSFNLGDTVVFASPMPALIKFVSEDTLADWYVFHNDKRDKKELPNGKIIFTVAQEGWELV